MSGLASDHGSLTQSSRAVNGPTQSIDLASDTSGFAPIDANHHMTSVMPTKSLYSELTTASTEDGGLKEDAFVPPTLSQLAQRRASVNDALDPPRSINLQAVKDLLFDTTPLADGQVLSAPLQAPPAPLYYNHGIASLPSPSQSKSTSLPVLLQADNSSTVSLPNLSSPASEKRKSANLRTLHQTVSQLPASDVSTVLSPSDPPITWTEFMLAYSKGNWDPLKIPKRPILFRRESSNESVTHQSKLRSASKRPLETPSAGDVDLEGYSSETNEQKLGEQINALGFLPAPKPVNEAARRRALYRLNIINAPRDPNFARVAHLAKLTFGVETALISLVDENEQWFKNDGLNCNGTHRNVSFCAHALLQSGTEPLIVKDATKDWRFAKNPLVTGEPHIRFYAGAPLRTTDGYNLGSFCLIDSKPKDDLSPKQRHMLKEFASILVREMELHSDSIRLKRLNQMQDSVKDFAQICLERDDRGDVDKTMKELYETACKSMKETLGVDGVCVLDLLNMELMNLGGGEDIDSNLTMSNNVAVHPGGLSALAEEEKAASISSHTPPKPERTISDSSIDRSNSPFATGAPIQVLGEALPSHSPDLPPDSIYASLAQAANKKPGVNPDSLLTPAFIAAFLRAHPLGFIYQNAFPPSARHFFPLATKSVMLFPIYNVEKEAFALLIAYTFDDMFQFEDADLMFLSSIGILILGEVMKHRVIIADRAKGTFISNISHELRTPLHGILASLELIQETPLTSSQVALLDTIESCGKSLIEVINHVLDFSKLGANARRSVTGLSADDRPSGAALERVNLVRVIEEVVESCYVGQRARASNMDVGSLYDSRSSSGGSSAGSGNSLKKPDDYLEGVEFILEVEPRLAGWIVKCEKGGVRRVLMNLIGNSLKFTTAGYVHVSVTTTQQHKFTPRTHSLELDAASKAADNKKISLVLTVSDTGKGISPQFLQSHLFHPFTQEDPLHIGTGLGMSIVKMIVENMGGKIEVRSEVGIGTEIRVFLDVEQCEMDHEEAKAAEDIEVGKMWTKAPVSEEDEKVLRDVAKVNIDHRLGRPLRLAILGIDPSAPPGKRLLQDTLQQYATEWMGLQLCNVAEADVAVVDEDLDMLRVQLSEAAVPVTRLVIMVKNRRHPALDQIVASLRQQGQIVEILNKPYGPIKLARAVTRVFEDASETQRHEYGGADTSPRTEVMTSPGLPGSHEWSFVQPAFRRQDSELTATPTSQVANATHSDTTSSDNTPQRPPLTRQWGSNRSVEDELRDQVRFDTVNVSLGSGPHSVFTRRHSDEKFAIERRSREKELAKRPPLPPRAVTERRYVPSVRSAHHSRNPSITPGGSGPGASPTMTTSMYHRSLHDQLLNSMNQGFGKGTMQRPSIDNLRSGSISSNKTNTSTTVNAASSPGAELQTSLTASSPSTSMPSFVIADPLSPTLYPSQPLMRPPKVLVVEDNQVNRMILGTFLRKRGIEHEEAHNGEVGVRKFRAQLDGFDIILMDIQMPTMDGNAATAAIREIEQERATKAFTEGTTPPVRARVFALTGLATAHDKKKAFASGVDSFLTKPVSLKVLGALFEKWGV